MKLDVKKNTVNGAISGVINKLVVTLLPFVMRTIMIHVMGTQYLGLSSLFTSILNMLSLAELGFGGALVYSMYKPIAENDTDTICALMGLYKKIYRIIGTFILIVGLIITPFVKSFINGAVPDDINVYSLYLIYLANTCASYFLFAYKNSLLAAFQRNDISNIVSTVLTTMEYGIQITLVLIFRNYYCYVIVFPVFTVIGNIVRAIIVDKKYSQYECRGKVPKEQRKEIYKKTTALACHKIGNTVSTSLDSLVVSSFLGLSSVAIFGNYNLIVGTLMAVIWIVYYSMTAGIANRMNLLSKDDIYADFKGLTAFNNALTGWATGCLLVLYQPFIEIWTGRENLLSASSAIVFSLYFYVYQSRKVVLLYKDAAGLWREDQWKPIVGAIFNLVVNITLVQIIGIDGVIISSILSFLLIEIPWESIVLFQRYFDISIKSYVIEEAKALMINFLSWIMLWMICSHIPMSGWKGLIVCGIICVLLPLPYLFVVYKRNQNFMRLLSRLLPKKLKSFIVK